MEKKESLYIAGPECFYIDGTERLNAMRRLAEADGFSVSLPNDVPLKLDHEDLRRNADAIFKNCAESMNRSTAILCDLEFYRGPEIDGGSAYEIGMAYARGIRCYGYTRDLRAMCWKYQGIELKNGVPYDRKGRVLPYWELPFSYNIVGSTKIVEGDFAACLRTFKTDLDEERKAGKPGAIAPAEPKLVPGAADEPVVYLAGPERFEPDAAERYGKMKRICRAYGLRVLTPMDETPETESEDPYARAFSRFERNQRHVRGCDILIANLNDFHGWEPESDTSFECGMAYQLGKRLYGYMDSAVRMRERVPNLGEAHGWRDVSGCNVENFDYPINLMFASSMPVYEGAFEQVIKRIAEEL